MERKMSELQPEDDVEFQEWCKVRIHDLELCDLREAQWLRLIKANTVKIDILESENETLKEELAVCKQENSDLQIKANFITEQNLKFAQTWYYTEKKHVEWKKKQEQSEEANRQQLEDSQEHYRKTEEELELNHASLLAGYRSKLSEEVADVQTAILQEKDRLDQEHKEKLAEHKVELSRELEKFIADVEKSRKEEKEKEKALERESERHRTLHTTYFLKCGSLEKEIQKHKNTITNLLNREDLTGKVSSLENTVKENNKIIAIKNQEIAELGDRINQVRESFFNGNKKQAVLQDKLFKEIDKAKELACELEKTQAELDRSKMNMKGAKLLISDLENRILDLQCRLKTCEPDLIKQTEKGRKLQTQLLRFQNDLALCMPAISDTKKFKSAVTAVKHRHVDGNAYVQHPLDKENENAFRDQIPLLKKMLTSYDKIRKNDKRVVEQQYVKTRQKVVDLGHTHLKIINEQRMELYNMRKEIKTLEDKLKDTEKLLEKAAKPAAQKVKSWIKKKVLRTHPRVAPEGEPKVEPEVKEEKTPRYVVDMVVPLRRRLDMQVPFRPPVDMVVPLRPPVDKVVPLKPPVDKVVPLEPPVDKVVPLEPPSDSASSSQPALDDATENARQLDDDLIRVDI